MNTYRSLISWRSYTHSWQLLGSHDSARIRTVVGDAARQEVAAGLLATMPGTPVVFAGDELGLTGTQRGGLAYPDAVAPAGRAGTGARSTRTGRC